MGKAVLVEHLSTVSFSQTELGELRIQQPWELHARLMPTGIPRPKRTFRFCTSGWQICKMNNALLGRQQQAAADPDVPRVPRRAWPRPRLPAPTRSEPPIQLSPPTVENALLKKSISLAHTQPVLFAFAVFRSEFHPRVAALCLKWKILKLIQMFYISSF